MSGLHWKNKFNVKEMIKGIIMSLVIIISILIFGYLFKSNTKAIWSAIVVTQAGLSLLWLIIRLNFFSISSRGTRRIGNAFRDRKVNKLGAYDDAPKKPKAKHIWEIQQQNTKRSKQGIYTMMAMSLVTLLATLWMYF